jgi:nucleoside-diphosphate-sugar epimerase
MFGAPSFVMSDPSVSKNLLVTGASGFIGRYVAAEASRRGYRVTGVDRNRPQTGSIDFTQADIRDKNRISQVMEDHQYVVHLAAVTSNVEFVKRPAECYDINANGFLNVLDAAAQSGCKRFVYASSAAVYLDNFSEDTVIDIRKQGNHYAKTKIMNEMVASSYERIYQMRTTGLRFFNVYGNGENAKGDYASIVTLFLTAKKKREPLVVYGDGTQARDLIHVTDAARVTMDLLERGTEDLYNVGTGLSTSYTAIAKMIERDNVRYVPNPLHDYQHYTRADVTRLRAVVGDYQFVELESGIRSIDL